MNMLNHSTSIENLFLIFEEGAIKPQPYLGGDSRLPAGEIVTFAFRGERRLSFADAVVVFPFEVEATKGSYVTYDGDEEDEWYIYQTVPLEGCKVELNKDFTLPEWDSFQYAFNSPWDRDFNAYSDENEARLLTFYKWLKTL